MAGIGGSDAPAIVGIDPWRGPIDVYDSKLEAQPDRVTGEWVRWGLRLEGAILAGYAEESGRKVKPFKPYTIRRRKDRPWQQYSPDGQQECGERGRGIVQVKNVNVFRRDAWIDGPPENYRVQLQHEMAVEGAEFGTLVVLFGGNELAWWDFEPMQEFQESLAELEASFWERVQKRQPPRIDPTMPTALESLKRLYPHGVGDKAAPIVLPGEAARWLEQYAEASEQKKSIEKYLDEIKARIQLEMGENAFAIVPGGGKVSWKNEPRAGYEVQPSNPRVMRITQPK